MYETCTHPQPNASHCFVCGYENEHGLKMTFHDDGVDTVISRVTPAKMYEGYPGVVHGGVIASILDEVVGRVAMVEDHHRFMMTVNMLVKYRHPVPIETPLLAVGELTKMKGRIAKASGKIYLPDETIACEAELTLAKMPSELSSGDTIEALNWKILGSV